jgi:hypothetical protein
MSRIYRASTIKRGRRRATKAEMEERAEFRIDYASAHGPITVRGLYYQAEVACLPSIDKDDKGYAKVQRQVLHLRREGRLDHDDIADATRWMRKPRSHNSVKAELEDTAQLYRKSLWYDADDYIEVWVEKDALAGVIYPITSLYDVPLMVTRGFSSETFCYEAIAAREGDDRCYYVYTLFDYDRPGKDSARSLQEKLKRFADEAGITLVFNHIAVTREQIRKWELPTRSPKRRSAADKKWPHDFACELDAIPPDRLRDLVEGHINLHLPQDKLEVLKVAEESEREIIAKLVGGLAS